MYQRDYDMKNLKELLLEYYGSHAHECDNARIYVKDKNAEIRHSQSVENIFIDGEGDVIIEIDKTLL